MNAVAEMPAPLVFTESAADKVKQLIDEEGNTNLKRVTYLVLDEGKLDHLGNRMLSHSSPHLFLSISRSYA